jgi:hypothetical protein
MQLTQTNWDAIASPIREKPSCLPAGQDDILGVVVIEIHNKCIYTRNSSSVYHFPVFFVQYSSSSMSPRQRRGHTSNSHKATHKPIGMRSFLLVRMTYRAWQDLQLHKVTHTKPPRPLGTPPAEGN